MVMMSLMLATGLAAAIATWAVLRLLHREYLRYRATYEHETGTGLADFFLFLDPAQIWSANVFVALTVAGTVFIAGGDVLFSSLAGGAALWGPGWALIIARRKRLRRIDEQLPDFLLALSGALRAGSGLQAGIRLVSLHTRRPLAQELGLLQQQLRMGIGFDEALDFFHARVATESTGLLVASIKVAGQTGGSLAEILERIAFTLRTRLQLLKKVRALTSQGRLQAWIMACLPLLLIAVLHVLEKESMRLLWSTPAGWGVLATVAVLEITGVYSVKRIVNIEV